MRPIKHLTAQARLPLSKATEASASRPFRFDSTGAAASPLFFVGSPPNRPIVIWYGEDLSECC